MARAALMTATEILCVTVFWVFTLVMAYKFGYVEGGADEFERLSTDKSWDEFS